jgi:hypothetical protein
MPAENLEEQGLQKNPNLDLAQLKYLLSFPTHKDDESLKGKLMAAIKEHGESRTSMNFDLIVDFVYQFDQSTGDILSRIRYGAVLQGGVL